ncbi:hypothetical protein BD413DRAFT_430483, partial [Trametes elegans]
QTMYKLIRRISSSFFSRPDRPWSEDATSTAPQIGRKRRLSTDEAEERETTPSTKKHRAESEVVTEGEREQSPAHRSKETEEVKEVTEGVREVELEDGKATAALPTEGDADSKTEEAAAVPLPDSPELKPSENTQTTQEEPAAKVQNEEEHSDDVDAEGEDVAPDVLAEPIGQDDAATAPTEDEVPGLTLAS